MLSTPPAFVLSQDQTLRQELARVETRTEFRKVHDAHFSVINSIAEVKRRVLPTGCSPDRLLNGWPDSRPTRIDRQQDMGFSTLPYCPHWRSVFSSVFKEHIHHSLGNPEVSRGNL